MKKVKVTFLHSPRRLKLGLAFPKGSTHFIPLSVAKEILKEYPHFLIIHEDEKEAVAKTPTIQRQRTRPVKREKDS